MLGDVAPTLWRLRQDQSALDTLWAGFQKSCPEFYAHRAIIETLFVTDQYFEGRQLTVPKGADGVPENFAKQRGDVSVYQVATAAYTATTSGLDERKAVRSLKRGEKSFGSYKSFNSTLENPFNHVALVGDYHLVPARDAVPMLAWTVHYDVFTSYVTWDIEFDVKVVEIPRQDGFAAGVDRHGDDVRGGSQLLGVEL